MELGFWLNIHQMNRVASHNGCRLGSKAIGPKAYFLKADGLRHLDFLQGKVAFWPNENRNVCTCLAVVFKVGQICSMAVWDKTQTRCRGFMFFYKILKINEFVKCWQAGAKALLRCGKHDFFQAVVSEFGAFGMFGENWRDFIHPDLGCLLQEPFEPVHALEGRHGQVQPEARMVGAAVNGLDVHDHLSLVGLGNIAFIPMANAINELDGITCLFAKHLNAVLGFFFGKKGMAPFDIVAKKNNHVANLARQKGRKLHSNQTKINFRRTLLFIFLKKAQKRGNQITFALLKIVGSSAGKSKFPDSSDIQLTKYGNSHQGRAVDIESLYPYSVARTRPLPARQMVQNEG
jgi:hypothetical protein